MSQVAPQDLAGRTALIDKCKSLPQAVADLMSRQPGLRQERLSGIHNPWGHAIGLTDPWLFLEFCESRVVINAASALLGPDIILWDSELFPSLDIYADFLKEGREGRYWPVAPLEGAVILASVGDEIPLVRGALLKDVNIHMTSEFQGNEPIYVIRLMPATCQFNRDPKHSAHRNCMEEQVLINYAHRPLWVISGDDRANNDLITGFAQPVPIWAAAARL